MTKSQADAFRPCVQARERKSQRCTLFGKWQKSATGAGTVRDRAYYLQRQDFLNSSRAQLQPAQAVPPADN